VFKRIDGTEFPSDLWVGPLEKTNGDSSYIVVVHDITGRLQAQRELETTRQQFFHQDKMAAIGQLAAGILHEVGNPIAAIAGAVSAVQHSYTSADQDDELSRNIDLINEQILRLGKITREIADFSSPKPRERELLDLNELLRSTAGLLSYDRRFSSIGVQLQLDKNLPAIVGVADQLTQVFMNLLINAMDACAAIDLEEDCIVIKSELEGNRVHVCVQDYGPGMSKEVLGHVMELFFTTKPVGKGSGLGLSLCDTIVREHGGEMSIESEEGKGAQVHVILPIDGVLQDSVSTKAHT
ncbi:MAG: ATP-binding protein, partial [Gammaproteobacteria bacterium]|nr:ATP-binding protein [Gammaproteobacteria bacterium]